MTNLNHYYQEQRQQALHQQRQHDYINVPRMQTKATSTTNSPWHELHNNNNNKNKSKCRVKLKSLQLLRQPSKWKLKRSFDEIVKCLIIASSEHVYDYDVLW